jgi:hypothetical protein
MACSIAWVALWPAQSFAGDVATAEVLFQEGRRLMLEGKREEACEKFAESQRLDPSSGTLINLATCHAELGLTATAWAEFLASARMAYAQQRPQRGAEAERRAAELEPLVSYVTVNVPSPPPGLTVYKNDTELSASTLGVELPVDPGPHRIVARAPGYSEWSTTITISKPAERAIVDIPPLELVPPEPAPPAPAVTREEVPSIVVQPIEARPAKDTAPEKEPRLGASFWVAAGTTAAATTVTAVAGFLSLDSYREAESLCPTKVDCSTTAMDARDRAEVRANVANVALGTALVAAVVTGWLYLSGSP